ncbi:hypothetical protein EGW08_010038 [Elysia chlorotica]|uniref:Uncharacterized protein n=1 Tax=Elysia chlorotica TaxID=188477 RepID=A0A3S0ZT69_ELYCH|nr:hypothetical protein EGW08_010038 [Elysia chlorotica]
MSGSRVTDPRPPSSLHLTVPRLTIAKRRGRSSSDIIIENNTNNTTNKTNSGIPTTNDNNNKSENTTSSCGSPTPTVQSRKASADSAGYFSGTESSPDHTPVGFKPAPFSSYSSAQPGDPRSGQSRQASAHVSHARNTPGERWQQVGGGGGACGVAAPLISTPCPPPLMELFVQAAAVTATAPDSLRAGLAGFPTLPTLPTLPTPGFVLSAVPPPQIPAQIMPVPDASPGSCVTSPEQAFMGLAPYLAAPPTVSADFLNQQRVQGQGQGYDIHKVYKGHGMKLTSDTLQMSPCLRVEGSPCADDLGNYAMHVSQ